MSVDSLNIVIVGGGFAEITLARRLERLLPQNRQLILLSQDNCITYHPLLAEVVDASMLPGHVVAPIRQSVKRTRFCMATVMDIDFDRRHPGSMDLLKTDEDLPPKARRRIDLSQGAEGRRRSAGRRGQERSARPLCRIRQISVSMRSWPKNGSPSKTMVGRPQ